MRKTALYLVLAFATVAISAYGQRSKQNRYMFEEFTSGQVLMKNRGVVTTTLNYDWINQEINYFNNDEQMILTGLETIDTVYIADRKFIPYGTFFLEVVSVADDYLYINWKMDIKNKGKEGPMGTTSHSITSQKMDMSSQRGQGIERSELYVYDASFNNTYYIRVDNKFKTFNSEKSFLKLFPTEKSEEIKSYMKKQGIDIKKPSDVIDLTYFCMALK